MIQLPNGCYCGQPSVYPANWKTKKASLKKDWYIHYHFHNSLFRNKYPEGKFIIHKSGINPFKTFKEGQAVTEQFTSKVISHLKDASFNPISGISIGPKKQVH